MLIRWLMTQRGLHPSPSKAADEEAGQPLLSASWEHPQNNKPAHKADSDASSSSSSEGPVIRQSTVLELTRLSVPDTHVLLVAFVFGSAAALMSACVPYFTGLIIDYASIDPDRHAFSVTTLKLVGVAVLCGAFTGLRGGLFSLAMWRLNVRIRQELFKSLLAQEVGFYDTVQTGGCLLHAEKKGVTRVTQAGALQLNPAKGTQPERCFAMGHAMTWFR